MKKRILLGIVIVLLVFISSAVLVTAQNGGRLAPLPAAAPYQANADEQTLAAVYNQVIQSVVNINVVTGQGGGSGTGFVIDTAGHIVTNNHVVENAQYIQVTFNDGFITYADLIGRDPDSDLAVIKVDPNGATLQPVTFADSDEAFVGQSTLAIGSPFGQDFTLTTGIISALDRSLSAENNFSIPEVIQTDAAINPGNSGGPLLDLQGRVLGVNSAILSSSRSASGVGFAIPSNLVRRVVPYLMNEGRYVHSWLGISGTSVFPEQREASNLPDDVRGVVVAAVTPNGPAARAGLQGSDRAVNTPFGNQPIGGDIITAINGTPITQMSDLISYLEIETRPGDIVTLSILRGGQPMSVSVTLFERP